MIMFGALASPFVPCTDCPWHPQPCVARRPLKALPLLCKRAPKAPPTTSLKNRASHLLAKIAERNWCTATSALEEYQLVRMNMRIRTSRALLLTLLACLGKPAQTSHCEGHVTSSAWSCRTRVY